MQQAGPQQVNLRDLFGGAIQCHIPPSFTDVSLVRQVPDNQEVFADANKDQSVIVEIVEYSPQVSNEQCAAFHFEELASLNESVGHEIVAVQPLAPSDTPFLPPTLYKCALFGRQQVAKYSESARNLVNIYMAVIRLPHMNSEILITVNEPIAIHPQSSSATFFNSTIPSSSFSGSASGLDLFRNILLSFRIVDWSLFGS
jgi:hypothetical protein